MARQQPREVGSRQDTPALPGGLRRGQRLRLRTALLPAQGSGTRARLPRGGLAGLRLLLRTRRRFQPGGRGASARSPPSTHGAALGQLARGSLRRHPLAALPGRLRQRRRVRARAVVLPAGALGARAGMRWQWRPRLRLLHRPGLGASPAGSVAAGRAAGTPGHTAAGAGSNADADATAALDYEHHVVMGGGRRHAVVGQQPWEGLAWCSSWHLPG